ncbi:sensor histidine kinase [Actinomadura fibrosa]|uniref:histidine kinase n=1 Tax=Actinomadura fibrosa TaxID=111802 RepID=A0ABW2XSS1_9ACTN|nr:histidine kinase [Actinomadura fibrosa]
MPRRALTLTRSVLAWTGAVAYPVVLYATVAKGRSGYRISEIAACVALTALMAHLLRRRPLPAFALLLVAWIGGAPMTGGAPGAYTVLQVLVIDLAVGYLAATRPRRLSVPAAAAALVLQLLSTAAFPAFYDLLTSAVLTVLAMATAWTAGDSVRERRRHAAELAAQATARAVGDERLRIARELHDMVAHSIGIIAIQAGVGGRVLGTQPDEARKALHAIETTSRETLSGLRRMLTGLRRAEPDGTAPRDPAPGLADLDRLAAATLDAGVRVEVRCQGAPRPLPPDIDLSAFRIVQEAVTNVVRHAGTGHCRVTLDYRDAELAVEITDDGRGHGGGDPGYGLVGMRERVGLLNGRLDTGPRPGGGFRVAARLPVGAP